VATSKSHWANGRRLPRAVAVAVVGVGHWVLVFAVLFGMVQSGRRYFYCEAFGLLPFDPCVPASSGVERDLPGTLSEHPADCCEIVNLAAMPEGAQAAGSRVSPAARTAILPARLLLAPIAFASAACVDRDLERWRPPPRASSDVRAQLMVFLT
jgi:hypothetical protein